MFDHRRRLSDLRIQLKSSGLGSILITNETNVTYLSGFRGSDSLIVVTPDSQFFLTDSRYIEEARASVSGYTIVEVTTSTIDIIIRILKKNRIKKMGFESMSLPYEVAKRIENHIRPAKFIPLKNTVESLRVVKDKTEISRIKSSIRVTKSVLNGVAGIIKPWLPERSLSDRIECEFINRGARIAFKTIAACGSNCSKPHADPTSRKILKNDVVMIDLGCKLDLYNSDITRMIFIGKAPDKIKEIYAIVKTAQSKSIEKIRPGAKICDVDFAGRDYIAKKGYGKFFGHSMGHGVGMDVHEEPSISGGSKSVLRRGMVFTIEPAIYLPNIGGVRIEDMALVTEKGCEILTR